MTKVPPREFTARPGIETTLEFECGYAIFIAVSNANFTGKIGLQ
jgi:hypothetical protein